MAVRVGFEPTEPFRVHFFSKEALSTTQPPNRVELPQTFFKSGTRNVPAMSPPVKGVLSRSIDFVRTQSVILKSNLDHFASFSYGVGLDVLAGGAVENFAGLQLKLGEVPRAGNGSIANHAEGKCCVCMGAAIFERVNFSFVPNEGNTMAVEF